MFHSVRKLISRSPLRAPPDRVALSAARITAALIGKWNKDWLNVMDSSLLAAPAVLEPEFRIASRRAGRVLVG
jgi:hypothetical protein